MEDVTSESVSNPTLDQSDLPRSAQRLRYEAEVQVFLNRYGSLENVRKSLGFSQRKMCQLLLVDPSAWTRWHAPGARTPPHIYRALEWFLALEGRAELHPRLSKLYLDGARAVATEHAISKAEVDELCRQIWLLRRLIWVGPAIAACALVFALWIR